MKKFIFYFLFFIVVFIPINVLAKNINELCLNSDLVKRKCMVNENSGTNLKAHTEFKYVIFGLNNCFWKKSLYDLLCAYKKKVKISFWGYLDLLKSGVSYACGKLNAKKGYETFFKYLKKESVDSINKKCNEIWEKECKNYIYKGAVNLFEQYKKNGNIIIAVDAGISNLYNDLCKIYKFDYFFASELEFKNGKTTGKLNGEPCSGRAKYKLIKKLIEEDLKGSLKDVICYANSHNDISLLEAVGKPVAVNPNSKLKAYAKKKGWQILQFKEVTSADLNKPKLLNS